jgi:hypothetical protein
MPVINLLTLNDMFFKCIVASDFVFDIGKADSYKIYALMKENGPVIKKCAELLEEYLAPEESYLVLW